MPRNKLNPEQLTEIAKLSAQGMSAVAIGRRFGVSGQAIGYRLAKLSRGGGGVNSPQPKPRAREGRFALCDQGKLHPVRRVYRVRVVAMVNVRLKLQPEPTMPAEIVTSSPAASSPPLTRRGKIDLSKVPSAMEERAASWKRGHD